MSTVVFYAGFIAVVLLVMVTLTALLQRAERRFPRFSRFLDRITPDGGTWREW